MRTYILKSVVIFTMLAALLATSCNAPELVEPIEESNPRTTIPYSLIIATDATKVTYNDVNNKYAFKTGDKFYIESGSSERDDIEGTLTYDGSNPLKLKGEISFETAKGMTDGTTSLKVTLINADNSDKATYAKGVAPTLKEAVEKYSLFTGSFLYSSSASESDPQKVSLSQQAAFLIVTVNFTNLLNSTMPTGETPAEIIASDGTVISTGKGLIYEDGENSYKAVFVAAVPGGTEMKGSKLSVCEREVEILADSKIVERNKKYTLNPRSVDFGPKLGDPFWSDGSYGRISHPAGVSVIGIIVYVNDGSDIGNALTEKSGDNYGHALVMSMYNVFSEGKAWDSNVQLDEDNKPYGGTLYTENTITKPAQTMEGSRLSGLANTNKINASGRTDMPAYFASQYRSGESDVISNTTGWFLPSIGQWIYTISKDGFGGANSSSEWMRNDGNGTLWLSNKGTLSDLVLVMPATTANALTESLNARMKVLDDDFSCGYDSFGMTSGSDFSDNYWTSSEKDANYALRMNFGSVETYNGNSYSTIKANPVLKNQTYAWKEPFIMKIRPFLAF